VHLGDIIDTVEDTSTGQLEYGGRVERGQSWVFRISPRDASAFRIAHDVIHEFGGAVETWGSITGVAIRGDAAADRFADRLQRLEDDGLLEYDTA
ncbi:hypothetical protein, partial [Pseudomonas viridiflava]|uniref:hypothetical protein n=1 Tax=Pseudomonas viridiflava TaxID=33069 RepID=UPI0013CEAF8A